MASPEFAALLAALGRPQADADLGIQARRAGFERLADSLLPLDDDVRCQPMMIGGVACDGISAGSAGPRRTIVFLHGGGYTVGSPRTHRDLLGRLSRAAGAFVVAPDYRLAPEHPFPAALEDAVQVYRTLLSLGVPPSGLLVAGDSAGGGLALSLLLTARDAGLPSPAGAMLISPWTDLTLSGASLDENAACDPLVQRRGAAASVQRYIGAAGDAAHPLVSPLFADLRGLAPLFIQVGLAEALRDDALRLAERANQAGVDVELDQWPEMIHIWPFFAKLIPEGRGAIDRLARFARARVRGPID
ncbi:alpha/beta hydrolase [Chelatococcus reniformis]|uniref:Alpha/beta hydrolase fold-3 domain-containing protein n=1 Tax=Chelatococcus reniformis TaxID=1494448 RepID=A0A916UM65_9HYPH|nr:alpha/beta hydrolase [Chelatococcus reniformis]GGC78219.1 hypothetical protein GCM10010994_40580 [Chelatococcus reniformis]